MAVGNRLLGCYLQFRLVGQALGMMGISSSIDVSGGVTRLQVSEFTD